MEISLYFLFSMIEYMTMFYLMFKLFRTRVYYRDFLRMVLLSFTLSNLDFFLKFSTSAGSFSMQLQVLVIVLWIWLVFNVHLFYSVIMSVLGFGGYILIQAGLVHLFTWLQLYEINDSKQLVTIQSVSVQAATVIICLCISFIIKKRNYGFTYVTDDPYSQIDFKQINVHLLLTALVSIVTLALISFAFWSGYYSLYKVVTAASVIPFWLLLYISFKKEASA